jgi:hypothetical protein
LRDLSRNERVALRDKQRMDEYSLSYFGLKINRSI